MNLSEKLIRIREHLSDEERYETCRENNKITGYSSGSLMNDLGSIWNTTDNRQYAAAYHFVCKAIKDLYPKFISTTKLISRVENDPIPTEQYNLVRSFENTATHSDIMCLLDRTIRYARLIAFS